MVEVVEVEVEKASSSPFLTFSSESFRSRDALSFFFFLFSNLVRRHRIDCLYTRQAKKKTIRSSLRMSELLEERKMVRLLSMPKKKRNSEEVEVEKKSLSSLEILSSFSKKKKMLNRLDTGSDAAIAAAIAAFEADSVMQKPEKERSEDENAKAEGDAKATDVKQEEEVAAAAADAASASAALAKPSTSTSSSFASAAKRTFSADDCSNDEALAWALHEADLPSNKGPSAFARAAEEGTRKMMMSSSSSPSDSPPPPPSSSANAAPPSPASAAAAPLSDWRALLERAASERVAGERFAPLVPRPLLAGAAAPPWPWSGFGSGGIGGGIENKERARLAATLARYGLVERPVKGDGACQFRALSDQLYGDEAYHEAVRGLAVQTLAAHPERYAAFICGNGSGSGSGGGGGGSTNGGGNHQTQNGCDPNLFTSYVARMSNTKEWGDHVTLQAAADGLGLRVVVVSSFEREPLIEIEPVEKRSARVLFLAFWHEIHYGSVYVAPPAIRRPAAVVSAFPVTMGTTATAEGENGFGKAGKVSTTTTTTTPEKIRRWFRERLA